MDDHPLSAADGGARPALAPDARPYVSPGASATAAVVLVGTSAAGFAILAVQGQVGPAITIPARDLAVRVAITAIAFGSLTAYLGFLGSAIAVPVWTHRACRNLRSLGRPGHLSPAWAAWSWFIPVVNVVLPWLAVQDLWTGSGGRPRGRLLLGAWWVAWLAACAAWVAAGFAPARLDWVRPLSQLLLAAAGLLLAVIVAAITRLQDARAAVDFPAPH